MDVIENTYRIFFNTLQSVKDNPISDPSERKERFEMLSNAFNEMQNTLKELHENNKLNLSEKDRRLLKSIYVQWELVATMNEVDKQFRGDFAVILENNESKDINYWLNVIEESSENTVENISEEIIVKANMGVINKAILKIKEILGEK